MKKIHFIALLFCMCFFTQCSKKDEVEEPVFTFPEVTAIDPAVYAEMKITCERYWDLSQMIDFTFEVTQYENEYVIHCKGYSKGVFYDYFIRVDQNGKMINRAAAVIPVKNFGWDNWPGKTGEVKTHIEFPAHIVSKYDLSLLAEEKGTSFSCYFPLDESEVLKNGRVDVYVYSTVEMAHWSLVLHLNSIETPFKPPMLVSEDYKAGDVSFGKVDEGILRIGFVRNNVLVIMYAPTSIAKEMVLAIDAKIQVAPEWQGDTGVPSYNLELW